MLLIKESALSLNVTNNTTLVILLSNFPQVLTRLWLIRCILLLDDFGIWCCLYILQGWPQSANEYVDFFILSAFKCHTVRLYYYLAIFVFFGCYDWLFTCHVSFIVTTRRLLCLADHLDIYNRFIIQMYPFPAGIIAYVTIVCWEFELFVCHNFRLPPCQCNVW